MAGSRRGFTLVELLVVVAIVALLIGILLPTLGRMKNGSSLATCLSNLHAIHSACVLYAMDNRDHLPDLYTVGNYGYRIAPGRLIDDRSALPEVYGLAVVLDQKNYLKGNSSAWVCQSQPQWMINHENTYAFTIASNVSKKTMKSLATGNLDTPLVWDNFSMLPGLSGIRGGFGSGFNIPTNQRVFPHNMAHNNSKGAAMMYVGGHSALQGDR